MFLNPQVLYESIIALAAQEMNTQKYRIKIEVPSHTSQSGQHKQINKQMLERMRRKGNPSTLLVRMQTGEDTVENSMNFLRKLKMELPFDPAILLLGLYP